MPIKALLMPQCDVLPVERLKRLRWVMAAVMAVAVEATMPDRDKCMMPCVAIVARLAKSLSSLD